MSQQTDAPIAYISQPAHAALAGRFAARLNPALFGQLPTEAIDAIERHDSGWAAADLTSLEAASSEPPQSFLACNSQISVEAWQRSISQAENRSTLAAIITSRHFCMLAPRDNDPIHGDFVRAQNEHRESIEADYDCDPADLNRYTSVIGFCDLLSLCVCSGLEGLYELPLGHPADPASGTADRLKLSMAEKTITFDRPVFQSSFEISVIAWMNTGRGILCNDSFTWRVA